MFLIDPSIDLELDCIVGKPMNRRFLWYIVHTEILSTFHARNIEVFKMKAIRRLGFLNAGNFNGWQGAKRWDAFPCQTLAAENIRQTWQYMYHFEGGMSRNVKCRTTFQQSSSRPKWSSPGGMRNICRSAPCFDFGPPC